MDRIYLVTDRFVISGDEPDFYKERRNESLRHLSR